MVSPTSEACESGGCGESNPPLNLPARMFAIDHEPIGVRVTSYHTSSAIKEILAALDPEEVQILRSSSFGKLINTSEKPTFSGRFTRYMLSRQLKVKKQKEAWFLFAASPVRFSLRECCIVTGLPCGKFPKQSRKRMWNNITETPYWPSLFGKLDNVFVKDVIRMLKRRTIKQQSIRVKYACLALLAAVLFPTTHHPKIYKEHAKLIQDIEEDEAVANMVKLIEAGHNFKESIFKGGFRRAYVERMRRLANERARKAKNGNRKSKESDDDNFDGAGTDIVGLMLNEIKQELVEVKKCMKKAGKEMTDMRNDIVNLKEVFGTLVDERMKKMNEDFGEAVKKYVSHPDVVHYDEVSPARGERSSPSVGGHQRMSACVHASGVQDARQTYGDANPDNVLSTEK